MQRKTSTLLLALFQLIALTLTAHAQSIGSWQTFPAYYQPSHIVEGGDKVWVLASSNLMSYTPSTGEVTTYTKGSPLSDAVIANIAWNNTTRTLLVLYANGNIDLVDTNAQVTNLSDYYQKDLTYDKTVNNIVMDGRFAYLATAFGIVKVNTQRAEIDDTYTLGTSVNDVLVDGAYIYAATEKGLMRASTNDNLMQSSAWTTLNTSAWTMVARLGQQLLVAVSGNIRALDPATGNTSWRWDVGFRRIQRLADRIIFYGWNTYAYTFQADGTKSSVSLDNTRLWQYRSNDATWWTGTDGQVAQRQFDADGQATTLVENILPNCPRYNYFGRMKVVGNTLFSVPGMNGARQGAVQTWDGQQWTAYDDSFAATLGHAYRNITDISTDPTNPQRVLTSGATGVYEFVDGAFKQNWTYQNSPLDHAATIQNPDSWPNYTTVYSSVIDSKGTLWCTNSISATTSLLSMSPDGTWTRHPHSELMTTVDGAQRSMDYMTGMMFDSRGLLWFCNNDFRKPALVAYNTDTDAIMAYTSFVNEDGAKVDVTAVSCVAEDLEHNIWIGTNAGPLMLQNSEIASGGTGFYQVKVPRNDGTDLADYLLANVGVTCMAVDGGGRKWIGTGSNGIYLISADNMTQIQHFTADNSPLASNEIESVAVNGMTGQVFIATPDGLCAYMADASEPAESMTKDNVYAYPNPVRPDFTGRVTVTGLTLNADVKIVSASGALVAEGKSNGGTFTWDLRDLKGRQVASGVYMVQTATSEGGKGTVCKIAVVR